MSFKCPVPQCKDQNVSFKKRKDFEYHVAEMHGGPKKRELGYVADWAGKHIMYITL